jgi:hypothetical protein
MDHAPGDSTAELGRVGEERGRKEPTRTMGARPAIPALLPREQGGRYDAACKESKEEKRPRSSAR